MKRKFFITAIALLICTLFLNTGKSNAAEAQGNQSSQRYVALHDRILPFQDIRVTEGDTKVPLSDIAKYLYLPVETDKGKTIIRKRGIEFRFDPATGTTTKDGKELAFSPIQQIDGITYISVKYIAREIGFQLEFFQKEKTIRIYRDNYAHMNHDDFQHFIHQYRITQQEAAKPNPTPDQPQSSKTKPNVYLTFDDGPNQYTTINLQTLKDNEIKGTFFFLGKHMQTHPSIVEAAAKEGHYIGSHSMTHDKDLVYKSTEALMEEMKESTGLIQQITGNSTKLVRVPYGSKPHVTADMQKQLAWQGYKMWDWDVDSNDWRYKDIEYEKIFENVKNGVLHAEKAGDRDIVILLHDRSQTTKALPDIIQWLTQEGYQFKTYDPQHHIVQNFLQDKAL